MNRNWIRNRNRVSVEYRKGIDEFIKVASEHVNDKGQTLCPCAKCNNCSLGTLREIRLHLGQNGMSYNYTTWTHHGEQRENNIFSSTSTPQNIDFRNDNDEIKDLLNDSPHSYENQNDFMDNDSLGMNDHESDGESHVQGIESGHFETLLREALRELYPGCDNFSVLTTVVELMHCKVSSLMSNKSFDHLLGIIKRILPNPNNLPGNYYEARKILKGLGMGYEKIHACKYDCALFYKENEALDKCPVCGEPRYLKSRRQESRKVPQKVWRYFPHTPRLKRLYMSAQTATDMRWHKEGQVDDKVMRHPADAQAWKEFEKLYPDFAEDPWNVRLGLATDGFNPFNNMCKPYNMWPVILVPYTMPPWRCMRKELSMMTLLIPGEKAPGKDIDVYLRPLIDEMKQLWEKGVPTFDRIIGSMFNLRAVVMWMINDFPAYANLSG